MDWIILKGSDGGCFIGNYDLNDFIGFRVVIVVVKEKFVWSSKLKQKQIMVMILGILY